MPREEWWLLERLNVQYNRLQGVKTLLQLIYHNNLFYFKKLNRHNANYLYYLLL